MASFEAVEQRTGAVGGKTDDDCQQRSQCHASVEVEVSARVDERFATPLRILIAREEVVRACAGWGVSSVLVRECLGRRHSGRTPCPRRSSFAWYALITTVEGRGRPYLQAVLAQRLREMEKTFLVCEAGVRRTGPAGDRARMCVWRA